MLRKSSFWLFMFVTVAVIAVVATGCAKKQVVREEAAAKAVPEAKPAPPPPRVEPPAPPAPPPVAPPPREEAKPEAAPKAEAKPAPLDLDVLRIQFAFDDYSLAIRSKENLEKIAAWMKQDTDVKIQIQGNTCNLGTAEYNLALGEMRAKSAKKYLESLGVDGGRLSTVSYGFEKPRAPNTNEANRSLNRRDEFVTAK